MPEKRGSAKAIYSSPGARQEIGYQRLGGPPQSCPAFLNSALTTFGHIYCHSGFMSIILGILTVILILIALFLILVVLMQPAKSDGGMGATMGGGMAESAFGGETSNVLTKATIRAAIAFFVISLMLYLGNVYQRRHAAATEGALPNIPVPATAPGASTPAQTSNAQAEVLKQLQLQLAKQPQPAPAASAPAQPAPAAATPVAPAPATPPKKSP